MIRFACFFVGTVAYCKFGSGDVGVAVGMILGWACCNLQDVSLRLLKGPALMERAK